jgi:hypothetical protein
MHNTVFNSSNRKYKPLKIKIKEEPKKENSLKRYEITLRMLRNLKLSGKEYRNIDLHLLLSYRYILSFKHDI